jgi:hypothetical protein
LSTRSSGGPNFSQSMAFILFPKFLYSGGMGFDFMCYKPALA